MCGINPQAYLADVINCIVEHPIPPNRHPASLALVKITRATSLPQIQKTQPTRSQCHSVLPAYCSYNSAVCALAAAAL